jgi:hypothetical protein
LKQQAFAAEKLGGGPKEIAGAVVKLAYERMSTDNISVIAILLNKP